MKIYKHVKHIDTSNYSFGFNKAHKIIRCEDCRILFNTKKINTHKKCFLCRLELSDKYSPGIMENTLEKYGRTYQEEEERSIKIHIELERRMKNDYESRGVKWINPPVCKRITE